MQTYIGWINKVLPYSTRNYSQYTIIHHDGKECEKMCVHICVYVCIYTYPYLDAHVDETFLEVYSKKPTLEMGLGDWQPRKEGVFKIFPFWVLSCFLPHACMPKRCMLEH